jgi:lysophospholipase L1-like esterase
MRSSSKTREFAFKGCLSLFSLAVTLLILEVIVRVFFFNQVDTETLAAQLNAISVRETIQASFDPIIHFELKPNLHIEFHGALVVTNSEGFRVPEEVQPTPENALRIAVLGDSISFGWGVHYEDSFPAIYEQQMEQEQELAINLRNYSVSGYNTQQQVETFIQKVVPFQPDFLILSYNFNDVTPTGFTEYIHPEYGDNFFHSALIKFTLREWKQYQLQRNLAYDKSQHEIVSGFIAGGPLYEDHLRDLRRLAKVTDEMGIPVIVIIYDPFVQAEEHPDEDEYYTKLHKRITAHLNEMGFLVLNLYDSQQGKLAEEGWEDFRVWWLSRTEPIDAHPTQVGHQFIAEQLVEFTIQTSALIEIFQDLKNAQIQIP